MSIVSLTRSGKQYSPPVIAVVDFDFGDCLEKACAVELDTSLDDDLPSPAQSCSPPPASLAAVARVPSAVAAGSFAGPLSLKRPSTPEAPNMSRHNKRRRWKRSQKAANLGQYASPRTVAAHVVPSQPIPTALEVEDLPAMRGGYGATPGPKFSAPKAQLALELVEKEGFDYLDWDGCEPRPLLDSSGRIFSVLVGKPRDSEFQNSAQRLHDLLLEESRAARFAPGESQGRRGSFPALNIGITYGNGSRVPVNLSPGRHAGMVKRLLADKDVIRLANFASASFAVWAPKVYGYYKERLDNLWRHPFRPPLKRNFTGSIFSSATFNFGPATCTVKHRDHLNCPFGMCAIQALGNFNPKLGGHLVLWDIKKVVEFPPGSLVLIPSATIYHSNTPIQAGETRTSFTQYCPGALFRYVDNGFCTEDELRIKDAAAYERMFADKETRWTMGLGLLSHLGDLVGKKAGD